MPIIAPNDPNLVVIALSPKTDFTNAILSITGSYALQVICESIELGQKLITGSFQGASRNTVFHVLQIHVSRIAIQGDAAITISDTQHGPTRGLEGCTRLRI